jgi:uncharacterized HhH-GPD family protein
VSEAKMPVTGDEDADRLLEDDPLALLIGMLLDQQVPMEWAFRSPHRLRERLGGELDVRRIAEMEESELEAVFKEKPALHRYPGSMAKRTQELARHIVGEHDADPASIWRQAADGGDLLDRVRALPGFGDEKARIFVAVLAKRFDVTPGGWEEAAAPYSDDTPRSVADIDSPEALGAVRQWKKAQKARG